MPNITLSDFASSTFLYDSLYEHIKEVSKKYQNMEKLIKAIKFINDKNSDVLQTNIVGYFLLVNETDQARVLDALELNKKELIELCQKSPRLQGIGQVVDQFAFALPLLLLAGELHNQHKEELAQGIFLFSFYRPYSSKISSFFTYGTVDELAMNYTTTIELNDKSYIHKYGTVYGVLVESAKTAYSTFIDSLAGKPVKPTDNLIYNNIFYSAIFSKTGSWIKSLYGTYKQVKTSGKALKYDQSFYSSFDDDSQELEYDNNEINSNSSVKRSKVAKALTKFNMSPVDSKLVTAAARQGFKGSTSLLYENFIIQAVKRISETKSDLLPAYFDAIVGGYLDTTNDDHSAHSASDINTINFLAYCKKNLNVSNTANTNILNIKRITEDLLTTCSDKYNVCKQTQQKQLRLGLYMYFVMFIQKA